MTDLTKLEAELAAAVMAAPDVAALEAVRVAALGKSGICKCTAAIRADALSLAFSAEAMVASPGISRSTGDSVGPPSRCPWELLVGAPDP